MKEFHQLEAFTDILRIYNDTITHDVFDHIGVIAVPFISEEVKLDLHINVEYSTEGTEWKDFLCKISI